MRDLIVTGAFVFFLSFVFKRPYVGVLVFAWISYMNPHRLSYGFAYSLPFAAVAAAVTLAAIFMTKEREAPPNNSITWFWVILFIWITITSVFALDSASAFDSYKIFFKVQIGVLFSIILIRTPDQIKALLAVIVFSIGFYGVKGGVFTILSGGGYRVWGPSGTFIEGNNELAVALLMIVPFVYFFYQEASKKWIRYALLICVLLMIASAVGSHSRGALLALCATIFFLWLQSRQKFMLALIFITLLGIGLSALPDHWFERMATIETYEQDASAMSRINAWGLGFNVAASRITGGGFSFWGPDTFVLFNAPYPEIGWQGPHSIYFEMLGEHGFIGLFLFLGLLGTMWLTCSKLSRQSKHIEDGVWIDRLCKATKTSLIAYMVGGAFLELAFFDLVYSLMAIVMVLQRHVSSTYNLKPTRNDKLAKPT